MDAETTDKGLIWASNPTHTAHYKTEFYNRVVFADAVSIPGVVENVTAQTIGSEARELEIELGTPDYTDGTELLAAALADISNSDFAAAESKLVTVEDAIWVNPMLAIIQLKQGKIEDGVQQLFEFREKGPDAFAEAWVESFVISENRFLHEAFKGEKLASDDNIYITLVLILQEYLNHYPDDIEITFKIASYLEILGDYNQALLKYGNIEKAGVSEEKLKEVQVRKAIIYSKTGETNKATELAKELLRKGVCCRNKDKLTAIIYSNYIK